MDKIIPNLWFDDQAEEAVKFYTSIFARSKIGAILRYGEAASKVAGRPKGSVMTVAFQLEGQDFVAINGGPIFTFTPAISLLVNCETQDEIDRLWAELSADPASEQCGWLKDKYGLSWQIVPRVLDDMIQNSDPATTERVMSALLQMKKLDLKALKEAYGQRRGA